MFDYQSIFGYLPDLTFTLEQHLKNYAECEENARRLLESFHVIREKMKVNLRPVIALFPHYSEHSHEHSEHIISAIEKLLGKERIEKLSPADTWMLLVCAYMHDIGMLVQGKELETDWNSSEFQQHIVKCLSSNDNDLKKAAINVTDKESSSFNSNWPIHVYRDVILLASEFYRSKHPERATVLPHRAELKQALNSVMSGDGKIPTRIQDVVGKICYSHGISFNDMLKLLEPIDSLLGYTFHPRFISSMLCIGDLCDLDNGRFNLMAIEIFGGLTPNNLIHYYKHESVTSFVIQKDLISVTFDIQNKRIKQDLKNGIFSVKKEENKEIQDFCDLILLETQNWISWMVDIVNNIKLYWNEFNLDDIEPMSTTLNYKILVDSTETVFSKKNMRFSFSKEKAYELIEGYSLYNNKFVFIRELLQNSIDALKKQFWSDILSGRWDHFLKKLEVNGEIDYTKIQPFDFGDVSVFDFYKVKIYVEHNEGEDFAKFIIEDNGTGINRTDVENRIIRTGNSPDCNDYSLSKMPEWLKPTSAFGIGLHSAFAVTDKIFIQTKTDNDKIVYNINMHSGKLDGYVFMGISEQQDLKFCGSSHGTQMEFSINVSNCMEILDESDDYNVSPMSKRPESNFCRTFQKMLNKMVDAPLFEVSYKFNNDESIKCDKLCEQSYSKMIFEYDKRNNLFGKVYTNEYYDFAFDVVRQSLVLWDRYSATLIIFRISFSNNLKCKVSCKGFSVGQSTIYSNSYMEPNEIYYLGGNTKDILNISRDNLSIKQLKSNEKLLANASEYINFICFELLKLIITDSSINKWHYDIAELTKPWLLAKNQMNVHPKLSEEIFAFLDKYNSLLYHKHNLKFVILKHCFCVLLKAYKEHICSVLNDMTESERIKPVLDFNVFFEDIEKNNSLKEHTNIYEFVDASVNLFECEDDQRHIIDSFIEIFKDEFADIFIKCSSKSIYKAFGYYQTFGEIYTSTRTGMFAHSLKIMRKNYQELIIKEGDGAKATPLDAYLFSPLTDLMHLLVCENADISPLKDSIISELAYLPGYENSYGFIDANNVGDILFSTNLNIEEDSYNEKLINYFPFLKHLVCSSIVVNKHEKLILQFNKNQNTKQLVNFGDNAFVKLLNSFCHMNWIPVPIGYEDIAVNRSAVASVSSKDFDEFLLLHGNYSTYLWDTFYNIREKYSSRIFSNEDKEGIINEIMPKSKTDDNPIINLLRYIYHNRVFNKDLNFEDAWTKIFETYRKFVSLILDCI